jgi:calnexin
VLAADKMKASLALVGLVLLISLVSVRDVVCEDEDFEDEGAPEAENLNPEEAPKPPRERPVCIPPVAKGSNFFSEAFESEAAFNKRWIVSQSKKDGTDEAIAKYDGKWSIEEPTDNPLRNDLGLVLKSKAKHHAISVNLKKPFDFSGKPFIVQYEVKFQEGQECGGAYIKLLSKTSDLSLNKFNDKTPYTIMFGPDKCGNDQKLHFIFRHKNPLTGAFEEKHAKKPTASLDSYFTDKKTHLYTLIVRPDNTFEIYVDQNLINSGSLLTDMSPPVNPPKEVSDPDDKKPKDWDEREKIADPDAVKPEDWNENELEMIEDEEASKPDGWLDDEPELIPDPSGEKPSDWDEDMDGEWEPPMINNPKCEGGPGCGEWKRPQIKNPKYKGKWYAPTIDNPNYKGKWSPRIIPNPNFFEDLEPYKMTTIGAIGLELWSMSDNILFDNFLVTDDKATADQFAADSWVIKNTEEASGSLAGGVVQSVMDATQERPWLWAVIIVVVILPIVLLVAYCCMSPSKPDEVAERKKTDTPTADSNAAEEDDEQGEQTRSTDDEEPEAEEPPRSPAKKPTKGDLEATSESADAKKSNDSSEEVKSKKVEEDANNETSGDQEPDDRSSLFDKPKQRKKGKKDAAGGSDN